MPEIGWSAPDLDVNAWAGTASCKSQDEHKRPPRGLRSLDPLAIGAAAKNLERYSHIRSHAKQAAIRCLEEQAIEPILDMTRHRNWHSQSNTSESEQAKSLQTNGGPPGFEPGTERL
jgi:hypothetical protein